MNAIDRETAFHDFDLAPGRLWSLWDMLRFRAPSFVVAISGVARAATGLLGAHALGLDDDPSVDAEYVLKALKEAEPNISELPLSRVLKSQFERLLQSVGNVKSEELAILIREFHNNLIVELTEAYFLMIEPQKRELYQQRKPPFGQKVSDVFPEATQDIAAANRCAALDEWTACVFHSMRILEHGLRWLAGQVGLPPDAMAHEQWKNIIDKIESKIKGLEALPKSPEKSEKTKLYSSFAAEFGSALV